MLPLRGFLLASYNFRDSFHCFADRFSARSLPTCGASASPPSRRAKLRLPFDNLAKMMIA
jgi:hypothetical protein